MEKYFDRLLLPTLRQLTVMAKLDNSMLAVLDLYAHLRKHIFLDGSPSRYVLSGEGSCGVPQGCPLACLFTNLAAAALDEHLSRCSSVELCTYLDDRVYFARDQHSLEHALGAVAAFDSACGCTCNAGKSYYSCFGCTPRQLGPILASMPRARNSFRYLGIDILVQGCGARTVAKQRVASFLQRCSLVSLLPAAQRSFYTADAVASLWLSAGSLYTLDELDKMVSASASALRPRYQRDSRVMLRSRLVEHLCGSLFHRTHPIAAAVYDVSLQIRRLFRFGLLSRSSWQQIWQARSRCRATPLLTLERCSKRLDIAWGSSSALVSHDDQYSLTDSHGVVHLEGYSKQLLREVLRTNP